MNLHFNSLIIGGGAAGFFAAANAASFAPGKKIAILEKSNKLLSKVRVSGGGRCNVTHACFDNRELVKFYPRGEKELLSAFSQFGVKETIAWFESRGVKLKTEEDGRMFPVTDDSLTIVNCLLQEARKNGVDIFQQKEVTDIEKKGEKFLVTVKEKNEFTCNQLLLAAGGFPKPTGYDLLKSLGHTLVQPVPSLFTFNMPGNPVTELMGVSVENAHLKISGTKISSEGPLLITHWGMSGPAVLRASAWGALALAEMNYNFEVIVNWIHPEKPAHVFEKLVAVRKDNAAQFLANSIPFSLPKRLWKFLVTKSGIDEQKKWADVSNADLRKLEGTLLADNYPVKGKTTFKEEFVTSGGVALEEINFKTMESKILKGLFFAGEILNIDAVTGGFNFQSAWTTGWIAARGLTGSAVMK